MIPLKYEKRKESIFHNAKKKEKKNKNSKESLAFCTILPTFAPGKD
jgi:hypothetical protein